MNESVPTSIFHYTISKMIGDMNFVGIFFIITGAIYCLTIVGAIVGIPIIMSGMRVRESASHFQTYLATNDSYALEQAIERQSKFYFMQKILMIITIVFLILYFVGIILLIAFITSMVESGNFNYTV
jgi:hypothetical protein